MTEIGNELDNIRFLDIEGFIRHETQQAILDFAKASAFAKSTVYEGDEKVNFDVRKSESKEIREGELLEIEQLKERILNMLYEKHEQEKVGIGVDIVRYKDKCFLKEHQDPYIDGRSYNREYTAIMYIKKPEGLGRTIYPHLNITIEPNERKMFLFKNIYNGKLDKTSVHMGEETIGEKIILVFFLYRDLEYVIL